MKRLLPLCWLLVPMACSAFVLVSYNPSSTPVANLVTRIDRSAGASTSNSLVNPVLPDGFTVGNSKVSNGVVVLLTTAETNQIAATNAANAAIAQAAFRAELRQRLLALYDTPTQDTDPQSAAIQIGFKVMAEQMIGLINTERAQHSRAAITTNTLWNTLKTAITNEVLALP